MKLSELLEIRDIGRIKARYIFYLIFALYILSILYYMREYQVGSGVGLYMFDHHMSVIFAPIYEEVLFRGVILVGLMKIFTSRSEVIIWSGILFGVWHFKNFPYMTVAENLHQVIYTVFLGSFLAWLALRYKTIWLGVMIHYVNNIFLHPVSFAILALV